MGVNNLNGGFFFEKLQLPPKVISVRGVHTSNCVYEIRKNLVIMACVMYALYLKIIHCLLMPPNFFPSYASAFMALVSHQIFQKEGILLILRMIVVRSNM